MRMTPAPAGGATPPPQPPAPAPAAKTDLSKPAPNQRRSGGRKPKTR
jgi:hypothetical protein